MIVASTRRVGTMNRCVRCWVGDFACSIEEPALLVGSVQCRTPVPACNHPMGMMLARPPRVGSRYVQMDGMARPAGDPRGAAVQLPARVDRTEPAFAPRRRDDERRRFRRRLVRDG